MWVSSKESVCQPGDMGSSSPLGRSPGEENSNPLQYSCLENPMDYTVHGVEKSRTQLSNFHRANNKPLHVNIIYFMKYNYIFLKKVLNEKKKVLNGCSVTSVMSNSL